MKETHWVDKNHWESVTPRRTGSRRDRYGYKTVGHQGLLPSVHFDIASMFKSPSPMPLKPLIT